MSPERIGRVLRALRHERDWTQSMLAVRAGCSRTVISRLEGGNLRACSLPTVQRVFACLDADMFFSVRWRGGELDRLLDADHARLGERWGLVRGRGWLSRAEVTYSEYGERGSIDELAFDPASGTLLCVELKTGIYEANRVVAKLDEKARLAAAIGVVWGGRCGAWSLRSWWPIRGRIAGESASTPRCSVGSRAEAVLRVPGCAARSEIRVACCCSYRCQMCVARTVGEPGGSACGPLERRGA